MKINVVYASRDPNRAGVILEALGANSMAVTIAQRAKEVLGLLAHRSCDLLLVGQRLMDEEGITLVKTLRSRGPSRQIPIIALVEHGEAPAFVNNKSNSAYALFAHKTSDTMKKFGANGPAAPVVA